jgi:hypothetical protein
MGANHMNTLWGRTTGVAVLAMMLSFSATAQTQPQPDAQTRVAALPAPPGESEVPVAVAKELQAMKSQIGHLESRLNDLAASVAPLARAAVQPVHSKPTNVTLTGKVSCGHCEGIQPMHKGYTQSSWALYSVSQGDDIVLVATDKTYKLQGDRDKLLKFMCDKARVTGRLESAALEVETIGRAPR